MGAAIVSPIALARDEFSWKRHRTHFVWSMILSENPVPAFPDHAPGSILYCSGSRASANPLSAATALPAAGFSAPAQQENLMMPGSQCRRFFGGRRELRQRGYRATSRKFLLFTEV
jgi:hypothetical protein